MIAFEDLPAELVDELAGARLDPHEVYVHVRGALDEDLPEGVDVTSEATISPAARAVADFGARAPGVVAGLGVAELALRVVVGDELVVQHRVADGTRVQAGDAVMRVVGPTRGLLTAERTALNLLGRLCEATFGEIER